MSPLLTPARSDGSSSRASHILPTVKCSSCNQPVPLSALGGHVCSPQPLLSLSKQTPSPQQQLAPHEQLRLRSNSQSVPRSRPSLIKPQLPNATSHVPFPSVSTPSPRPEDYMPGGESGMAGVGRRAFQAAAHAAVFAQHHPQHPYIAYSHTGVRGNEYVAPQFLDIASSGRG